MNARQRREAAQFVAAGGSFERYTLWDRLGPVLRGWFGRRARPVRQELAPRGWS